FGKARHCCGIQASRVLGCPDPSSEDHKATLSMQSWSFHVSFSRESRAFSCKVFSANLQEFSRIMVVRAVNHPISPGRRIEGTYSPVRCPKNPLINILGRLLSNRIYIYQRV